VYRKRGLEPDRRLRELTWPGWRPIVETILAIADRDSVNEADVAQGLCEAFLAEDSPAAKRGYPLPFLAANPNEFLQHRRRKLAAADPELR
jgi:hypothetical protein